MASCIRWLLLAAMLIASGESALAQGCDPKAVARMTQPFPRPDFLVKFQQRYAQQLATGSYETIALGDSIMFGWPPAYLQAAFGGPVLNVAFGGDGAEHLLWRLETMDWSQQHPRRVLLLIGTNDLWQPGCAVAQGILTVVHKVHSMFPQATVIVTSVLPRGADLSAFTDNIAEVNRRLAEAAPTAPFRFLDVHDAFLCDHRTPCPLYLSDKNLHLARAGYDVLMEHLQALLRQQG